MAAAGLLLDRTSSSAHLSIPALQSRMKCDPQGYEDELLLQLRHFDACLSIFHLTHSSSSSSSSSAAATASAGSGDPSSSRELADMAMFLAHVAPFHPKHLAHFPKQILGLLQSKGDSLPSALRRQLTQALILLRNRQMIELVEILPVLMELQTLGDRTLRKLAALHIVQDVRRMNMKHRNESKNRALQNIIYQLLQDDSEVRAKRALILLCELHKRKLWADERTSNTICTACFHPSSRILKATLSFLLGYENVEEEDEDDSSDEEDESHKPSVALSREAIYKAHHKGTKSSKRKKQAKLERVKRSLIKKQRNQSNAAVCSSSPLQYLHDPQGFAEKLFSRLHSCNERFEVKLMMIKVISRTIGLHRLIILNFYPFLQKYVQPHQCEVTHVLAAAVQACHDMVPPDAVESLLRQLVNQFVHDRARPEVIAVGLNVVREMCTRMPLIMTRELLHDLALYKKSREKAISAAARSIIAVFRQVYPSLLEKRDRGKSADLLLTPNAFGQKSVPSTVPGIELLANNEDENSDTSDDESGGFESGNDDEDDHIEDERLCALSDEEDGELEVIKESSDDEGDGETDFDSDIQSIESDMSGDEAKETETDDDGEDKSRSEDQTHLVSSKDHELKRQGSDDLLQPEPKRKKRDGIDMGSKECSLRELKKLVTSVSEKSTPQPSGEAVDGILSDADFMRIKKLQAKKAVKDALSEHGFGKAKRKEDVKLLRLDNIHERRVNPDSLTAKIRQRREKEERIASVRAGQEDRESYKSRTSVKQSKTGGLSNRQKEKHKNLPLAAKLAKASKSRNQKKAQRKLTKQFRGRKAWK